MKRTKPRAILAVIPYNCWYKFQDKFVWGGFWCFHADLFKAIDETYFTNQQYDIALNDDFTEFKKIARLNNRFK
jgi:hypothetical protein